MSSLFGGEDIDRQLLQALEARGVIEKRNVVWWQLGFEGRRILSNEEFEQGLETQVKDVFYGYGADGVTTNGRQRVEYHLWKHDDVPITLRRANLAGLDVECLVSVKPFSHVWPPYKADDGLPLEANLQPHVRGIVIERTNRHLFYAPVGSERMSHYSPGGEYLPDAKMFLFHMSVFPSRFYNNLLQRVWRHGRRAQQKFEGFDVAGQGYALVPYYDFDPAEKHVSVYPVSLFDSSLDLPVFFKAAQERPYISVLGVGTFSVEFDGKEHVCYCPLVGERLRKATTLLEKALAK